MARKDTTPPGFNSRSREGSDFNFGSFNVQRQSFNSRSREGSDEGEMLNNDHASGFNSRSREGSDGQPPPVAGACGVSIRAPARGATYLESYFIWCATVSIRAPARGATSPYSVANLSDEVSIRAPARGATLSILAS